MSAATGIEPSRSARPRSAAISSGRRLSRSAHTPAKGPARSPGASSAAETRPISSSPALRAMMAAHGNAVRVMSEPKADIPCPAHSLAKS